MVYNLIANHSLTNLFTHSPFPQSLFNSINTTFNISLRNNYECPATVGLRLFLLNKPAVIDYRLSIKSILFMFTVTYKSLHKMIEYTFDPSKLQKPCNIL